MAFGPEYSSYPRCTLSTQNYSRCLCFRCHRSVETALHALHDCTASSLVWENLGWSSSLATLPGHDALSWLLVAWDVLSSTQHYLFTLVLWSLWNARNAVLFDSIVLPLNKLFFCAKNYDAKFQKILLLSSSLKVFFASFLETVATSSFRFF